MSANKKFVRMFVFLVDLKCFIWL